MLLRFKTTWFLLLFLLISIPLMAQQITGKVIDGKNEPVIGAVITLIDKEGKFITGTSADIDGAFIIGKIPEHAKKLIISSMTYENKTISITSHKEDLKLGTLKMGRTKSYQLGQVNIKSAFEAVVQRDDTTAYNAAAFKTNPDASAEDLLKKLPGMDFTTGKAKSQGEDITKVLVDGKPFFGDDPSTTLKNLPAEIIDQIEVYDEKSEEAKFTGFDDGNTTKTVNIVTKPEAKGGWFGKVSGGVGNEGKYTIGGNVNYFKGARRVSVIGHMNNVNEYNYASDDMGGGMVLGGGRGGGNMFGGQGGITTTRSIGVNYNDEWGDKMEVSGSYFFNNRENLQTQSLYRKYVLTEQLGQEYQEDNESKSENFNHQFNARLEYKFDTMTSILLVPSFNIQNNNSFSNLQGRTFSADNPLINSTLNTSDDESNSFNARTMFIVRHKLAKPGRTVSVWANIRYNNNDGYGLLQADNVYEVDSLNQTLDQEYRSYNKGWNMNSSFTYTEPLTKRLGLRAQYGLRYEDGKSDRRTYNFDDFTQSYDDLETPLSNDFTTQYITHRGGFTLRYNDSLASFNLGLNAQSATLTNERVLPNEFSYKESFENLLPFMRFRYKFSKNKNFRIMYRTYTDAPSVNQVQDVIDNRNPLQLSVGNPTLKQAYQNYIRMRYNSSNVEKSSNFFVSLSGRFTKDYIGRSTIIAEEDQVLDQGIILPKGAQIRKPINIDGYQNYEAYASYGQPISFIKSNLNLSTSMGYTRTPGMINEVVNFANNTYVGLGVGIGSNISENVDFNVHTNGRYNWVVNSINERSNQEFYNQTTSATLNVIFWKGIVFNTQASHQFYTGLSDGYNQNFVLWNMGLGKKFLKNDKAEIRLSVYDLLGQNSSIERTISEIYSEDVRTNVLQRYVMLSFTYKLREFKGDTPSQGGRGRGRF